MRAELTVVYVVVFVLVVGAAGVLLIRRWQYRRALLRRLAELAQLADIGRAISSSPLDLHELAERVYTQAGQFVDVTTFQLGLIDSDRYRLLTWIVDGERRQLAEFRLEPTSLVAWVRDSRQGLLVKDFEREAEALPARPGYASSNPPRSAIFVPLVEGERALGAMAVQSWRANAFTEEHLRLLNIVAAYAAAALQAAYLYEQARQRATHLELLAGVSRRINVLQAPSALYRQVVDLVVEKLDELAVSYFEAEGGVLRLQATAVGQRAGSPGSVPVEIGIAVDAQVESASPNPAASGARITAEAAQSRRIIFRHDLPPLPQDAADLRLAEGCAEFAVPVQIDERLLGVLHVSREGARAFDDGVPALVEALAAQMSIAILQAQVYALEQRRAEHLSVFAQVSRMVASTLELDDLLDEVLDVVDEHFGYKAARIFLLREASLVFQAGTGAGTIKHTIGGLAYPLAGPGLIARVGRTLRAVLVHDVQTDPDYVAGPGLESTRSEMAAPMVVGPRLLGVFDVQADTVGAFTNEDARILQTLADTLTVAVRNARLFEYERRRRRLAEIMRELSVALTSTLQLDSVLELILNGLALVVDYDAASILLVNEMGEMVLRASRGAPDGEAAIGRTLNVRRFEPGEELPSVLSFHELDTQHEYHDLFHLPEPHACLAAPLAPGGVHLGYLVVDAMGKAQFPQGEVELIATFASQAAVAIENARLYTAQREQAWISTALLQVAEATAQAAELADVLATVSRLTPMLVGVDRCAILLNDAGLWRFGAFSAGDGGGSDVVTLEGLNARFPDGVPVTTWRRLADLLSTREPVVVDPEDELPDGLQELFIGVVILLPLMAKGDIEGVLIVGQAPGETPFTGHRIQLIGGIANQAALAIESALLTRSQQEEAWVSTALLQVAESVAGRPLDEGLETVVRLTPILVGVEKLAIFQYDPQLAVFRLRQAVGGLALPDPASGVAMSLSFSDIGLYPEGAAAEAPWQLSLPETLAQWFGASACYIWPLRAREDVLGLLVVEAAPLLGRRLTILNGIAHQLAMAMENARLAREVALQERLERELEVGRDIQASFLPQDYPLADGWEVAAFWRAARQVGGDFYDFIPLAPAESGPRWGVVIADVADKGVPAALFMALSRTLLRTVAINRIRPADTLARVNQLIMSDARSDQFVTIFYGVWEPALGTFHYAVGGHNPPLWASAGGGVRVLPGQGIALGVVETADYQEEVVQFQPGDTLVLYTDGLTESVDHADQEFGLGRVMEVVRATQQLPAPAILARLAGAVDAHTGGMEPFDDLTMVVLKYQGESGIAAA